MARYVVRYGTMRMLGVFSVRGPEKYARGMKVVARTSRGMESGEVLCEATEEALAQMPSGSGGQIVRELNESDANEITHLQGKERTEFQKCQEHVRNLNLPMELIDIEH